MIIQVFLLDCWRLNLKVLTVVSFFWCERVSVTVKQNPIYYNSFVCFLFFEILQVMEVDVMKVHFKLVKLMLKLV